VWWHAESNNLVLLAVVLEFYRAVALVAVNNKQPICPSRGRLRMSVEVLKPRQRNVIIIPASRRDSDNPVAR
jgi:Holliday junction resolvase RusA-like endonuclease